MDGIDLKRLVEAAKEEERREKEQEIQKKISFLLSKMAIYRNGIRKAEADIKRFTDKLTKAESRLSEMERGNWEAVNSLAITNQDE